MSLRSSFKDKKSTAVDNWLSPKIFFFLNSFQLCSFSNYSFKIVSSELPVYSPLMQYFVFPVQCVLCTGDGETLSIETMDILLFSSFILFF